MQLADIMSNVSDVDPHDGIQYSAGRRHPYVSGAKTFPKKV